MRKVVRGMAAVLLVLSVSPAQAADDPWADFRFLIGEWVAEGKPDQGTGEFSLTTDLHGKILVRRNWAKLPATQARPAAKHEDLMVIYRDADGKQTRADYYDNEGHVIRYAVAASADKKELVFLSEAQPRAPRFRLTYTKGKEDTVAIKFEIAPPGKPEEFKFYLQGTVRRKTASKDEKTKDAK
jgi:hypothetical protein